ncbi:MAG: hypothetical protein SWX82_29835 [Cyanobacteriota bacterium]|nr:hypothetical protein [Cyanobacteriota bacterium]
MEEWGKVVRQGSVGSVGSWFVWEVREVWEVGSCGKCGPVCSKVGGIIVPVSFWEVSVFRPNFLVLKGEKFALFSRQKS